MRGLIVSLNVSRGGVPKRPVPRVALTPLGLDGDLCAHPEIHGGPEQAVLVIASEAIDEIAALGFAVFPGALGENVTTEGLDRRQFRAGQRFRLGPEAIIELTKPRGPCRTLDVYGEGIQKAIYDKDVRQGNPASERWGMSGFYARVLQAGVLRPGDLIWLIEQAV